MKPYYEQDGITIYCGDCRESFSAIAAHRMITDPPYGFRAYPTDVEMGVGGVIADGVRRMATTAVFGYPELLVRWCVTNTLLPSEWVTWWPARSAQASVSPV